MSDAVVISSGELTAAISPVGAELLSLRDAAGREYMTDADPAYWTGHAPLLFPIVGGLAGDRYRLDGREYTLPRHGFARRRPFVCQEHEPGRCARFMIEDDAELRQSYPFAFELEMHFQVVGATLEMTATVRNPGEVPLPFSFGYHPAFAWPLPEGGDKLGHRIIFEQDEPQAIRRIDDAGLIASEEPTPVEGRELALEPGLFEADAIIWDCLSSRSLTYASPDGPRLEIAFPDSPALGLWQKPGANFICIEPWAGHADPAGFSGDFRDKPGIIELPPGELRSFRMDVRVVPA